MPRKSSIHFKPVSNVRFAVSHSERTDLSEPAYLLPKEHQLPNIVVTGSLSENDLSALFIQQKEGMTGQAKARGSSPFWEGVVVLPNTDGKEQSTNLQSWKKEYEKATGHKVLHMSVHLDEGYLDELGKPQYNPHAHVIVTRMDSKNRVINLDRKQLAQVQDLTASTLQMERGSTLAERQGKRGRAHVPHREFRAQADEKRLELDKEKVKTSRIQKLLAADTPIISNLKAELAHLKEQYRLDREEFKRLNAEAAEAGLEKVKSQKDYSDLKKTYEAALAQAEKVPALETQITQQAEAFDKLKTKAMDIITPLRKQVETMKTQIDQLQDENAKLEADKAKFAAMATAYQAGKAKGTPAHLIAPGTTPAPRIPQSNHLTPAPMPQEAIKTAQEAPKLPEAPIPSPKPEKSLVERLGDSMRAMLDWIKGVGVHVAIDTNLNQSHSGPVKHLDELHAVQHKGRGQYAVHRLADLDRVPALDDPKTSITYRGGVGHVEGKTGPSVQR